MGDSPLSATVPRVDVLIGAEDRRAALERDVLVGLSLEPKELPPKWFYDEHGSELFDEITRLPEYYLTDRERWILEQRAHEVARLLEVDTLVELGSGTSEKTRLLIDALVSAHKLRRLVVFDYSEEFLRAAASSLAREYRAVEVHAVVGDFEQLDRLPGGGKRLIAFLGSTIGNRLPGLRAAFLHRIARQLRAGEALFVGFDLVKDMRRLEAAYNDSRGVTAEFNRNVLTVLNRELHADFVPERFEHVARFDPENEWIEMLLRSTCVQHVRIDDLDLDIDFDEGEEMRTEISAKFRRERVERELAVAGLKIDHWWTDPAGDFALALATLADA
jgi:L-histidine N-alpha-methyltransferase